MKLRFAIISFLLSLFCGDLYADAIFAGNVTSVNSDSGLNALRNPALMSKQKDDSIGIFYMYSYLMHSDFDVNLSFSGLDADTNATNHENYNGALILSDVFHSGKNAYGIGITKTDDGQAVLSNSETDINLLSYNSNSTEKTRYFGSSVMLSYSHEINNNDSLGLQIETTAFNEYKKKNTVTSTPDNINFQTETTRIKSSCSFGYHLIENSFEFGAILNTGSFGIENQKYELTNTSGHNEHKISNYYIRKDGIGVLLGFAIKPATKWVFNFEAGSILPYSYKEKQWDETTLEESTNKINVIYTFLAKGGLNYKYNQYINFGFGGSYVSYKANSTDTDGFEADISKAVIYMATAGIDIRPSKNFTLLLGLDYKLYVLDSGNLDPLNKFQIGFMKHYIEAIAGISCKY